MVSVRIPYLPCLTSFPSCLPFSPQALLIKLRLPNRVQPEVMPPADQVGYYTNKMHFLKRHLLDELSRKRFALDFMQPVDAEALQVPTYYTIIRRPMDVGTIVKRVQNCYYYNVNELIQDFRLIISNCYTFNRPEDLVYRNGQKLEQFFEKVLAQMPPGDEFITTKDPKAERALQPKEKRASTRIESLCREELKRLKQCYVPELDPEVRECFKDKWMLLSKKLSKHHFRTVESFRAQVDETFAQCRAQARRIFESTYYETMEQVAKHLRNKELNDLLHALGQTEQPHLPRQDSPGSSWHNRLVNGLNNTAYRLQQKLETSRLINMEQQAELRREKLLRQQAYSTAHAAHATKSASSTTTTSAASTASAAVASPQKPSSFKPSNYVSDVERRAIQQQFVMLPLNTKIEIMHIIAQTEDISTDSCDLQWFDIKNFGAATLNLMKKAMHPHTKLNLRKMKPSEKEDLQRTLEMRLQNINQVLKGNRRKFTHRMRIRSTVPVKKRARYSTPANKTQRGAGNGAASSSANGQKRQWNAAAGRGGGGAVGAGGGAQATGNSKDSSSDSDSSDSSSSDSDSSSSDSSSEQSS